jgi:Bacterial Ig domain
MSRLLPARGDAWLGYYCVRNFWEIPVIVMEEEGLMPSYTTFASRLRVLGAVAAAGALAMGGLPAFAAPTDAPADAGSCVQLRLDNPHAGDVIPAGDYAISGRAVDTSGAAIDRVQLFLGDRNLGGTPIGDADLSSGNGLFSVVADTSSSNTDVGSHTLFAYARSTSGTEASVAVPVVLAGRVGPAQIGVSGAGATLGTNLPSVGSAGDCPGPVAPSNVVSPSGTNVTGTLALAQPAETLTVQIDSPNPGATITRGKFEVSGRATTSNGGAIDRVQVFLGNRDLGGLSLGQISAADSPVPVPNSATLSSTLNSNGTYRIFVDFPSQNLGTNTVFVYARSATTGKEASATTSVTISR